MIAHSDPNNPVLLEVDFMLFWIPEVKIKLLNEKRGYYRQLPDLSLEAALIYSSSLLILKI